MNIIERAVERMGVRDGGATDASPLDPSGLGPREGQGLELTSPAAPPTRPTARDPAARPSAAGRPRPAPGSLSSAPGAPARQRPGPPTGGKGAPASPPAVGRPSTAPRAAVEPPALAAGGEAPSDAAADAPTAQVPAGPAGEGAAVLAPAPGTEGAAAAEELPTLVPLAAVPLEKVSVAAAQEVSHRDAELTLSSGDLRRSTRHTVWVGLLLVLLGIGGFGAWATLAPLTSAVVAPGVVKLSGGRKVVQHLEGGIIREIAVKDGQRVQAHDVVLRLDDTQARANLQLLQGRYNSLVARASRLTAERDGHQEITFPATLREQSADPETARLMSGQQELFQTRRNALASQTRVLRDRLRQFETQIEGLEAQRKAAQEQLGFIKEEMDAARGLYEKGIYEKPKYLALQRAAADLRGRVGQHTSSIAQTRERIGETEAQILNLQTQQTNEVVKEHEEVRTALFDTEERLRAARDVLERTVVRSPEGGVVVGLKFHTVGGVIPAGASIMDIVAADDSPIIEVQVRPADIDAVKVGLDTDVRFTAFNTRTTPSVQGKVVLVSADRLVDPSGMPYYEVRVEVGPDQVALLPSAGLYPGMPAEVHIVTGQRTVLDYAARPLIDGLKRATASSL